jgi:exodeoxyribonuclease-3
MTRDEPDIVCLQELKAEAGQIPGQCNLVDYHVYWHGLRGYSGVSLHVRKDLMAAEPAFAHPDFDMESRMVELVLGNLVVASVYVPNGGKDYPAKLRFLTSLVAWAQALHREGREVILCGDINIARTELDVHPSERKPGVIGQRDEERALFEMLLGEQLVDVGRKFDPDNPRLFTWWAPWRNMRQRNIGWRLDYVLASQAFAARATGCVVLADVGTSDHAPVDDDRMMTLWVGLRPDAPARPKPSHKVLLSGLGRASAQRDIKRQSLAHKHDAHDYCCSILIVRRRRRGWLWMTCDVQCLDYRQRQSRRNARSTRRS